AGNWQAVRQIQKDRAGENPGGCAFAADSAIAAASLSSSVVGLFDVSTGRLLARLEPPEGDVVRWLCFSPDGHQLVAASEGGEVHVWDLRLIRARLEEIGLDWDGPP